MLRIIRIVLAAIAFILCTLIFLDFTGFVSGWAGWISKVQFLPAVLALNLATVTVLLLITVLLGRVYCSVICPMGVFQDVISWISGRRKKFKMRFRWSSERKWLRYGVFIVFIIALIAGFNSFVALLAPYSSYGRIVQNLFSPVWIWGNNVLAKIAELCGGYGFAHKEVWIRSLPTFVIAVLTFAAICILAWKNGRTYCNTVCPVGTFLSFFSRFAIFRPVIDTAKCKNCHMCERKCKSSCIDIKNHVVDYSRCVDCFNCIDSCRFGAMHYKLYYKVPGRKLRDNPKNPVGKNAVNIQDSPASNELNDNGRRAFLGVSAITLTALTIKAQTKKVDGGLATVIGKKIPERTSPIVPPGSRSRTDFHSHCTACQLCVSQCPNNVLRPSVSLQTLMQPEMSYERGWCRVECTKCSQVCPAGAILPITPEEKAAIHIGTATVDLESCVVNRDGVSCGNCARHCPAGAIMMVRKNPSDKNSLKIPTVNESRCIGCGACEYLCPSRPYSAIHVNGLNVHKVD